MPGRISQSLAFVLFAFSAIFPSFVSAQNELRKPSSILGELDPNSAADAAVITASARFEAETERKSHGRIVISLQIPAGHHIYSITQPPGGPLKTKIAVNSDLLADPMAKIVFQPVTPPHKEISDVWKGLTIEEHRELVEWNAPIEIKEGVSAEDVAIKLSLSGQICNDEIGTCEQWKQSLTAKHTGTFTPENQVVTPPVEQPQAKSEQPQTTPAHPDSSATAVSAPAWYEAIWIYFAPEGKLSLTGAILFGFIGGVCLNFMPCVLPVIGLKLLTFAKQAGHSRARIFFYNLWYCIGLMLVFMILAGLAAFLKQGWGSQFQNETFRYIMLGTVFVMALSFLGVWEIPIPGFVASSASIELQEKAGYEGAFFKGIFTTLLATPCVGPALGPVLGYTAAAPTHETFSIFASIGLGMASPFLIAGVFPAIVKWLPKPGDWMETFKEIMGFILMGTAIYLYYVAQHPGNTVSLLVMLLGLAVSCWWLGRTPAYAETSEKLRAWGVALAIGIGMTTLSFQPWFHGSAVAGTQSNGSAPYATAKKHFPLIPFTPDALQAATAEGATVMVDFSAKWCPNCHLNFEHAINTENVKKSVEKNNVVAMLADFTNFNPEIKQIIESYKNAKAVPILAIYPADDPKNPIVLSGVITESQVIAALEKAGPSRKPMASRTAVPRH